MPYNEADTRAKLIDPRLKLAGWGEEAIEREHYFVKGKAYTDGRIYLIGNRSRRREPRRADYILRYSDKPVAVLEAKDESHSVDAGLGQSMENARALDLPFAYSSNGHGFFEFDFFTNQNRELMEFPSPQELWNRFELNMVPGGSIGAAPNPFLHPYAASSITGKEVRYYQEAAITRVIERMMRAQQRILLTMATGTGKTFTVFQLVWKLRNSGWLRKPVLYIADRVPLRDQAFNSFGPFASGHADPRATIEGGTFNSNRELYFALYQALDAGEDEPLFERIPSNFFGLIIIDECHRSGFGKWNRILQHFPNAIQVGMTATPKRSENIDTYAYFCSEEQEEPIDPNDLSQGMWKPPAYSYSLGQGIDDGFLATYSVQMVRTSVDRDGLRMQEAMQQGVDVYVPEGAELKNLYLTPQFEREITLPDRTRTMTNHLAGLLKRFGPMDRTMVFCVDMEHARLVARLLQNEFKYLGHSDYAVPIVSEETDALTRLERFSDSERTLPVVATTAELLSTGVDIPSCRNIVFMKPLASEILFKQIIGRGSRVDPATGKEWFRIIDYVGATRLFDEWDRPPTEHVEPLEGPTTSSIAGTLVHAETGQLLDGASVSILISPNRQVGPELSQSGSFRFDNLPEGRLRVVVSGAGFRSRTVGVETAAEEVATVVIELRAEEETVEKIRVRGLTVQITDEATFLLEGSGQQLTLGEYLDYTATRVTQRAATLEELHAIWVDPSARREFLGELQEQSVHVHVLADVLARPEADHFDLLANIAFGSELHTRGERAEAFLNYEQGFLSEHTEDAREVIFALLDKYRRAGIEELSWAEVFRLSPFREMGQLPGVTRRLGGTDSLRQMMLNLQHRIYKEIA